MHRCACITRALDIFVKDLAGLQLGSIAKPGFRRYVGVATTRKFGSTSRLRVQELGTVAQRIGENAVARGTLPASELSASEGAVERAIDESKAGSTTTEPVNGKQAVASPVINAEIAAGAEPLNEVQRGKETESAHPKTDGTTATPSRAESRLQRKHRRLAVGAYRPRANGLTQEVEDPEAEAVDSRIEVLDMIEKLEGQGIAKRKEQKRYDADAKGRDGKNAAKTKQKDDKHRPSPPKKEQWQIQKAALNSKFGEAGWSPRKRLSPDTLDGIRALHASDPGTYSTGILAEQFAVSPENIRRILKSKWKPAEAEADRRRERWERRGVRKWEEMAKEGKRPPKKWRELGVGSVKGDPEEKPSWKRGGGRREVKEDVAWAKEPDEGLEGRII